MKRFIATITLTLGLLGLGFIAGKARADYTVLTSTAQWTRVEVVRDQTTGKLDATICGTVYKDDGGVADTGCVEHVPMEPGGPSEQCISQSAAGALQTLISGRGW